MQTRDLDRIRFVTRHFNDLQGLRYWVPLGMITLSVGGGTYFDNRRFVLLRAALFVGAFLLMLIARRYYRNTFGEVERPPVLPAVEPATLSIYSPAGPTPRLARSPGISPVVQRFLFLMGLALFLYWILLANSPSMQIFIQESLVQPPWRAPGTVFSFGSNGMDFPVTPTTGKVLFAHTMYALYGSFFLGVWLWRERRLSQSHYLALGVLLLGLSVVGATLGFFVRDIWVTAWNKYPFLAVTRLWMGTLLCGSSMVLAGLLDHWQLVWTLRRRPASREVER